MKHVLWIISLLITLNSYSEVIKINDETQEIDISENCYFLSTKNDNLTIEDAINGEWEELTGSLDFGPVKYTKWIKFEIENTEHHIVNKSIFVPYHHIHEIDLYIVDNKRVNFEFQKGTMRFHPASVLQYSGYDFPLLIPGSRKISVYIRFNHRNRPLRASSFILSEKRLEEIKMQNFRMVWFWRGAFLFALLVSITIYFFLKLRQFLYYFMLNVGIGIYMASQLGDYFIFFPIDTYDITTLMDFIGAQIVICFFPLFLNELVPIKKRSPLLWKIMNIPIYVGFIVVAISFYTPARLNIIQYYSHIYMMILAASVFTLQLVFLLISAIYKDKNAIKLFIIYALYVSSVYINISLPNMGYMPSTPFVYNSLLAVSLVEIVSFLLLMGSETVKIYTERQRLIKKDQEHQKKLLLSIINAQEEERNRVGRTIHDSIGGNMAIIRQSINNPSLDNLLNKTLKEIRNLSHGLVSPQLVGNEFIDEIKELTYNSNTEKLGMHCHFYQWPNIKNSDIITHLYRIVQELIQNALKHSGAANVHFQFIGENENYIDIIYEDDGKGFDYQKIKDKGLGFRNITNRLSIINGTINVDTSPGRGTVIMIEVDLLKVNNQ